MKKHILAVLLSVLCSSTAFAEEKLTVTATGIKPDGYVDIEYAFCAPTTPDKAPRGLRFAKPGSNRSLGLSWSEGPKGTASYVVLGYTPEGLVDSSDAGIKGRIIHVDSPRRIVYNWVLVNIPASMKELPAGIDSYDPAKTGPEERQRDYGLRGINVLSERHPLDPTFKGVAEGYFGPCPPPNDLLMRNYIFKVFALDVKSLPLKGDFTGEDTLKAMEGHILATGEVTGKYTLNPLFLDAVY